MLLSKAFDAYIEAYVKPYQADGTVRVFQRAKKSIDIPKDLTDITSEDVRKWQESFNANPNTIRLYTEKLRKVLAFHKAQGINCIDPRLIHSPKAQISTVEWLKPAEVNKLIAEALKKRHGRSRQGRIRNAAIVAILYSTGLRVHEITNLEKDCITDQNSVTVVGKYNKPAIVYVDLRSRKLINEYLRVRNDTSRYLFVTLTGHKLSTDKIRDMFHNLSQHYGKKVHPHMLRHSYATNLLTNGCHPFTLQRLMRHSTFLSTQKYLHVVDKELEEAHHKYHTIK